MPQDRDTTPHRMPDRPDKPPPAAPLPHRTRPGEAVGGVVWLTAEQAARWLGISRATLYAYVSRGLLSAERMPGERGSKRYRSSEVQRLAAQRSGARRPRVAARGSLDWGLPVLTSGLCLIDGGRLYYRGRDALHLSAHAALEDVAALLWQCRRDQAFEADLLDAPQPWPDSPVLDTLAGQGLAQRCISAAAVLQAQLAQHHGGTPLPAGPAAQGLPDSVDDPCPQTDARHPLAACGSLVRGFVALVLGTRPQPLPIHHQLRQAWGLDDAAADLLRQALVLCADHELNASSFTARCVAATGASLPACLNAALLALSGPRHGGMTESVERWWPATEAPSASRPATAQVAGRTRAEAGSPASSPRPELAEPGTHLALPGFGHPLYPDGDPRAQALLNLLPEPAQLPELQARMLKATGLRPSLDLALVALRRHLQLPLGSAFALFAIGRSVGWLAHALEQRHSDGLIRPRAEYTGPRPEPAPGKAVAQGRMIRRR